MPEFSFLPLARPNVLNDVCEGEDFVIVRVEQGGATKLTSAFEVTVQTTSGGSATGNMLCVV